MQLEQLTLPRNSSCKSTKHLIPAEYIKSSIFLPEPDNISEKALVRRGSPVALQRPANTHSGLSTLIRSLLSIISFPTVLPTCRWLSTHNNQLSVTPSLGRKVTGTVFGHRGGHISFAIQNDPRSEPILVMDLAISTSEFVREMSSGLVRISLECEKGSPASGRSVKLFNEPVWTVYSKGRKCGYAQSRVCSDSSWHMLSKVQSVSVGAGVIPAVDNRRKVDELLYMRAGFERVVASRDSAAFHMLNPGSNEGPELSIFLLRR